MVIMEHMFEVQGGVNMQTRWVSSREAAEELGISLRTLQSPTRAGADRGRPQARDRAESAPWLIPSPVIRIRADRGPKRRPGTPRHLLKDYPS